MSEVELTNNRCMFCGEMGQGLVEQGEHYCFPCRLNEAFEVGKMKEARVTKAKQTLQAEVKELRFVIKDIINLTESDNAAELLIKLKPVLKRGVKLLGDVK